MNNRSFIFKIDGEAKDITKTIEVKELQKSTFIIEPNEPIKANELTDIQLLINQTKIVIYPIMKSDHSGYLYQSFEKYDFNEIGIYKLIIIVNGQQFDQKIRALPEKISVEDYKAILEDIRNEAYNLVFSVFGKSSEDVRLANLAGKKSIIEFLSFYRKNLKLFKAIFARIEKYPNRGLAKTPRITEIYEAENFDDIIDYETAQTKIVFPIQQQLGFLPKKACFQENVLTFNVYENRLLKHFIGDMLNTLCYIESSIIKEENNQEDRSYFNDTEKYQKLLIECQTYKDEAYKMWKRAFLTDVSPVGLIKTSMVLQKEPKYCSFYKLYQEFRANSLLQVNSEYFSIPIKQAWQAYEIWVFLKVAKALQKIGFEPLKSIVSASEETKFVKTTGFNFCLTANTPLLEYAQGESTAKLFYQKTYPKLWETQSANCGSVIDSELKPDIVIELYTPGSSVQKILILDAKYRLEGSIIQALPELSTYAHNICDRNRTKLVKSAHIIYPGNSSKTYTSNLGYYGLLPNSNLGDFEEKIQHLFDQLLQDELI
jgi:hypothetical protein